MVDIQGRGGKSTGISFDFPVLTGFIDDYILPTYALQLLIMVDASFLPVLPPSDIQRAIEVRTCLHLWPLDKNSQLRRQFRKYTSHQAKPQKKSKFASRSCSIYNGCRKHGDWCCHYSITTIPMFNSLEHILCKLKSLGIGAYFDQDAFPALNGCKGCRFRKNIILPSAISWCN